MAANSPFPPLSSLSVLAVPGGTGGLVDLEYTGLHVYGPSVRQEVEATLMAVALGTTPMILRLQVATRNLMIPMKKRMTRSRKARPHPPRHPHQHQHRHHHRNAHLQLCLTALSCVPFQQVPQANPARLAATLPSLAAAQLEQL